MNPLIEFFNQWGGDFLDFAGAMFWQAGALIALIFAVDFFLQRKIRATVRYAFWLIILVKLLLPPTFALPTGVAWWLRLEKPIVPVMVNNDTVTYGSAALPMAAVPADTTALPLPSVKLDGAGGCLLMVGLVGVALLTWLLVRWWQVVQIIRRARDVEQLNSELKEKLILARHLAGGRSPVRLKIAEGRMSPAVCGLFRPVILLPRLLAEQLSAGQLGAVLLHELTHLRRGDVWVNCVQALLQIAYWWHPLVWLANARIRRVREEAVDDAVMLALRHEAEIYAPILLEVVKLAWQRPLMSLGLIGIMESRSALRQRIERLTDVRIPRQTGLTVASVCGLFVFSAVALPMGKATDEPPVPTVGNFSSTLVSTSFGTISNARPSAVFLRASIYQMPPAELRNLTADLSVKSDQPGQDAWWSVSPSQFPQLEEILKNRSSIGSPHVVTSSGITADLSIGNETNHIKLDFLPIVHGGQINLAVKGAVITGNANFPATNQFHAYAVLESSGGLVVRMERGINAGLDNYVVVMKVQRFNIPPNSSISVYRRKSTLAVLNSVQLGKISYHAMPLDAVLRDFNRQISQNNPGQFGVTFDYDAKLKPVPITIDPPLNNVLARDVLTAIVAGAAQPIQYSIEEQGIEFSWKGQKTPTLYQRAFKIANPTSFFSYARQETHLTDNNATTEYQAMRALFSQAGMDWESPPGQSVFFNDRLNLLFVKTTLRSMDLVEHIIQSYDLSPASADYHYHSLPGETNSPLVSAAPGVLADSKFVAALAQISRQPGNSPPFRAPNPMVKNVGHEINRLDENYVMAPLSAGSFRPQIHIKARFLEASEGVLARIPRFAGMAANPTNQWNDTLTSKEFKTVWHDLRTSPGIETWGEPEGVTLSGRQMQMRATRLVTIVTNIALYPVYDGKQPWPDPANATIAQTGQIETGPALDATSWVLSDGHTINLNVTAMMTHFFGYECDPGTNRTAAGSAGRNSGLPVFPVVSEKILTGKQDIKDGQTLVLEGVFSPPASEVTDVPVIGDVALVGRLFSGGDQSLQKKDLLVLITVTLVDAVGNPVHPDDTVALAPVQVSRP